MKEYEKINLSIREYFLGLGYNETMFETETLMPNQFSNVSRVDFSVKLANKIHIIVEAKIKKSFIGLSNDDFKYDPAVRQVQMYAMNIGAPYYVITNGSEFLWFETSDDGRPKKIEPIFFNEQNRIVLSQNNIGEALKVCSELLKIDSMCLDFMHELVLMLLARLAVKDNIPVEEIVHEIRYILEREYSFDSALNPRVSKKTLQECWRVLSDAKPENSDKKILVNTLKLLAQKVKNNYTFCLNDKLSEFLINLAKPRENQSILDPAANMSEISMALATHNNHNHIVSHCQSPEQYAFSVLINKILFNETHAVKLQSIEDYVHSSYELNSEPKYDVIISVFPFGNKSHALSNVRYRMPIDVNNIEDYMLLASIEQLNYNGRLVAIVPDSMLFAGGRREKLRQYIVENHYLRAVISLPIGVLVNSNIKTSIIVIDKSKSHTENVFFAIANTGDFNENRLFIDENSNSYGLLRSYDDYLNHHYITNEEFSKSFLVRPDVENLRAETFLSISDTLIESEYPLYRINDICTAIKRGSSIKNDEKGKIRFLGPGAIRANNIDIEKASYTSEENIKSNVLYVHAGTVLINNISSYLGAAALYHGNSPVAINQHIIALSPIAEKVLPQYLAIVLNSKEVNNHILRMSTGSTIPSITLVNLKDIKIPVPDIMTQQKIIDKVIEIKNKILELDKQKSILEKRLSTVINTLEIEEV